MRGLRVSVAAAAAMVMVGLAEPPAASAAEECMHEFGSHQRLAAGGTVQEWTVTDLKPSSDAAPGYPLAGQLWEATASVQATSGTITPIIPNFRAHTTDGGSVPVLWQLASPQSIPGSTIAQGQTSTGKLYFDVTRGELVAVTYPGSGAMPLMWCDCDAMMAMMPMPMPMENCPCCEGSM
jgi:hypothetical protein